MEIDKTDIIGQFRQKIVCIGWGSLIWEPGDLPVNGEWHPDGPEIPVEFARQSGADHITLVIVESDHRVPTLWAELNVSSLAAGIEALKVRERVTTATPIGRWPNATEKVYPFIEDIAVWARTKGIDRVVWTALQPGMKDARGAVPTLEQLTEHIGKLDETAMVKAATYITNAPSQITTPYRQALAQACAAAADKSS